MDLLGQHVIGNLITGPNNRGLHLTDSGKSFFLRFGLIIQGTDELVFPVSLIDDWGHENKKLELYEWIRKNGYQFPRAEVFGFSFDGTEKQYFIREIDLMARYVCYVYRDKKALLATGKMIEMIFITDESVQIMKIIKHPKGINYPLRHADVSWGLINPTFAREGDVHSAMENYLNSSNEKLK